MNYNQMSSLPTSRFTGWYSADKMKNKALSFGVITPPDKLPTHSLYDTVQSQEYLDYSKPFFNDEKSSKGSKAGRFSAGCMLAAIGLSALSLLPFIRKR